MKKALTLKHRFVEAIPEKMEDRTLYISIEYATATHKCCCGCGLEVVTPLTPTDWKLIFDGETVSLTPSIGNWSFPCRSHYWVDGNVIKWAKRMSDSQIIMVRQQDAYNKARYFSSRATPTSRPLPTEQLTVTPAPWRWMQKLFRKRQ